MRDEMWLTMNGHTQHLQPGAIFELEPNVPHDELYGAEGLLIGWRGRTECRDKQARKCGLVCLT